MELKEIIQDLQTKGLDADKILETISQMVQEEKLTPEDLEKAKEILEKTDTEKASKLFGVKLA